MVAWVLPCCCQSEQRSWSCLPLASDQQQQQQQRQSLKVTAADDVADPSWIHPGEAWARSARHSKSKRLVSNFDFHGNNDNAAGGSTAAGKVRQ
jgi:hypothetical protein